MMQYYDTVLCMHFLSYCLDAAHVTWFEKAELFARLVERDVLYPLLFASAATVSAPDLFEKFGVA